MIGTLESYEKIRTYFGEENIVPIYIEVEDGERLRRALMREFTQESPKYAEMCRRFLADEEDFRQELIDEANIPRIFVNETLDVCIAEIEDYIKDNLEPIE